MNDLDIAVDLSVLQDLDFPVPCGHSQHDAGGFTHDGPAEFIAVSYHDCPVRPLPVPYYYPCCAVWASFVTLNSMQHRNFMCSHCGQQGEWAEFVHILNALT